MFDSRSGPPAQSVRYLGWTFLYRCLGTRLFRWTRSERQPFV